MAYHSKYSGAEVDSLLDKIKADDVGSIDSSLSTTSENPVQNKVITEELNKKANKTDIATINGQPLTNGGNIEVATDSYDDTEIKGKLTEFSLKVGELSDLETTDKTSIVNAINEVAQGVGGSGKDDTLRRDLGKYTSNEQYAAISVAQSGKAINANGEIINKSGYGISNEIAVTKGSIYLFKSNSDIVDVALFTQKIVADIVYSTIEETITTAEGESVTRLKSKTTAKGGDLKSHTYEFVYNAGNETAVWDDIKDNGVAKGASFVLPTQYIEYIPMFSANGVATRPISGHYCLASSVSGIMVISAKSEDLTGYLIEVRYGVVASIVNNLARKADVEVVSGLYKRGVISQKQTWANDYSGYKMSNLVWGTIPQANIDLFISAGAEFNDTDAAITKTSPWGDEVQHLPGYFYLNGLGDISYEEMQRIYMFGLVQWTENMSLTSLFMGVQIRTAFHFPSLTKFLVITGGSVTFVSPQWIANRSDIEVLWFSSRPKENPMRITCTNKMADPFWNKVRYVQGEWDIKSIPTYSSIFGGAIGLVHFMVRGVVSNQNASVCKHLSNASILFMIQNEAATSEITITLHPDAYARAMADAEILAALETHTNISLASA